MAKPNLEPFRDWMLGRGRGEETAELYVIDVRACLGDPRGCKARLIRPGLAPSTKRHNLAALRAYCKFTSDLDLLNDLDDLKLEPPGIVVEKVPLTDAEWNSLDEAIGQVLDEVLRACLEMISIRGFRVGAIPALTRRQIRDALDTGVLTFVSKRRTSTYSIDPFRHSLQLLADHEGRWRTVGDLLSPTAREHSRLRSARQRLQRAMSSAADAAGIDPDTMYPHRLRRTYAEGFYAEVRGDLVRLRDHMGWADINTAARYVTRDRREELDAIAARMRKKRKRRKK